MAEDNKKGAGRPRTVQYYLLSFFTGNRYGDITFSCEIFPKRWEIEKLIGPSSTITSIFKFPCKEDYDNYNSTK